MRSIRLGLLGCGTVGGGVVRLLHANAAHFAERVGAPLEIAKVLVRDPAKERAGEVDRSRVVTDVEALFADPELDVVVEVMGGIDPAGGLLERAIDRGLGVVTANKMLLAKHGASLVRRAQAKGVDLAFEGSVGGGIPIIRTLRDALASDVITELSGIVNGTCNYMLTRMQQGGLDFEAALREAQEKGYAEADPGLDVDGHDAAHKLVVLAMLAFGATVDHDKVHTEGIRDVEPIDHDFAARFGYAIKHVAVGRDPGGDHPAPIELRVHPALLPKGATLANVHGVLNAVALVGRALGPCLLAGRGAGDLPTAVSVVADIVDVARARRNGAAGLATKGIRLGSRPLASLDEAICAHYLRFQVFDRPGVLASITGALGDAGVSIEQMVQVGGGAASGDAVQVVLLTHDAREASVTRALSAIDRKDFVAKKTRRIRVHRV